MDGTEYLLTHRQRLAAGVVGLLVLPLGFVEPGQVAEAGGYIGMIATEELLTHIPCLAEEFFGLFVLLLNFVKPSQVGEAGGYIGVWLIRPCCSLTNGQCPLEEQFSLLVFPPIMVQPC